MHAQDFGRRGGRLVLGLGLAGLLAWLGCCLLLYLWQDGMLFHPQPLPEARCAELRARPGVTELEVTAADGTRLRGWLLHGALPAPRPVMVLFGGNADEVSRYADDLDLFAGWSLAMFCYRGYGHSEGRAAAADLLTDALQLFDAVAGLPDIARGKMAVYGRSLGSGIAAHVAADRPVRGAVLVSPYDSLRNIAQGHFRWLPAGLLLRHHIAADEAARRATAPLLAVYGLADSTIPPQRAQALVAAWSGPKTVLAVPGGGHNDILAAPGVRAALGAALKEWRTVAD